MAFTEHAHSTEQMKTWLKQRLSPQRYDHSVGTLNKALEIAHQYSLAENLFEKIKTAALLHDAAKPMGLKDLFAYCEQHNLPLETDERNVPPIIHALVGAHLVKTAFKIDDPDIMNAIRYHSTGVSGMGLVEKVVFIADKIEENTRNPLFTKKVNEILQEKTYESLDLAVLYLLESSIQFLMEKRQVIHPRTLAARNELIQQLTKNQKSELS